MSGLPFMPFLVESLFGLTAGFTGFLFGLEDISTGTCNVALVAVEHRDRQQHAHNHRFLAALSEIT